MSPRLSLIAGLCCACLIGCANSISRSELKNREADARGLTKLGAKFAETRAILAAKGYRCTEPARIQTVAGPSEDRFCQIVLADGIPWRDTFNESTGSHLLRPPPTRIGLHIDDDGLIVKID